MISGDLFYNTCSEYQNQEWNTIIKKDQEKLERHFKLPTDTLKLTVYGPGTYQEKGNKAAYIFSETQRNEAIGTLQSEFARNGFLALFNATNTIE